MVEVVQGRCPGREMGVLGLREGSVGVVGRRWWNLGGAMRQWMWTCCVTVLDCIVRGCQTIMSMYEDACCCLLPFWDRPIASVRE